MMSKCPYAPGDLMPHEEGQLIRSLNQTLDKFVNSHLTPDLLYQMNEAANQAIRALERGRSRYRPHTMPWKDQQLVAEVLLDPEGHGRAMMVKFFWISYE